ncbi:10544_t:CDS:2 [Cetraspora pellucida]|uniref:10544_t:CDS:1 n=1 Tax=Cetraspora pellucida TaxID=1433469 RepID=A0ACA9LAJ3_9GLOM|nr:10544_t:CDS:2 [Cetraspora pellucida]
MERGMESEMKTSGYLRGTKNKKLIKAKPTPLSNKKGEADATPIFVATKNVTLTSSSRLILGMLKSFFAFNSSQPRPRPTSQEINGYQLECQTKGVLLPVLWKQKKKKPKYKQQTVPDKEARFQFGILVFAHNNDKVLKMQIFEI